VAEELAEKLADGARRLKVGDPLSPETEVGPLIQKSEVDRVHDWVGEAVAKGGKLLCGGKKIGETCYEPTVLLDPPQDARVSCLEVFGPVVNVYTCSNRDEAIRLANSIPLSFQASVFTRDIDAALDVVKRINAASVMINDHTAFRVDWMPFGGQKESGLGVGGIPYTMHEMTQEKLIVFRSHVL
jgi:acyl-CoA reductase-like NAD-dependent aldehyde dehydrogenase